jgi:hypothetical protein
MRERKGGFAKFYITTKKKFVIFHIIKLVTFVTSGVSDKNTTFGTRVKFINRMNNNCIT